MLLMFLVTGSKNLIATRLKFRGIRNRMMSKAVRQAAAHRAGEVTSAPGLVPAGRHFPMVALAHNIPHSLLSSAEALRRSHPPV